MRVIFIVILSLILLIPSSFAQLLPRNSFPLNYTDVERYTAYPNKNITYDQQTNSGHTDVINFGNIHIGKTKFIIISVIFGIALIGIAFWLVRKLFWF